MNSISFDNIYLIFLAIPLIVIFTVPFLLAIRKENRNPHNIASYVIHIVMAVVIAFAATSPTVTKVVTSTEVYVVADVSYSTHKNLDTIDNFIRALKLPSNSTLGLIAFAREPQLISELGDPANVGSVKQATLDTTLDTDGTDIVGALDYAGGMFGEGSIKRIVLITDGRETDMRDPYALKNTIDRLAAKGVKVDAIYLDDNLPQGSEEVQISYVEHTKHTYKGSDQSVRAVVQSGTETGAVLTLTRNGNLVNSRTVSLSSGINSLTFDLDTSEVGDFDYKLSIKCDKDTSNLNNECSFTQTVSDGLKILFITEDWDECTAAVDRYGGKVTLDIYENDRSNSINSFAKQSYIKAHEGIEGLSINKDTTAIPFSIEELCEYDEIILSNADIMSFDNHTEFVQSVDMAVSLYGKSFVTMGNLGIQSRSYAELKQLEDMLPVRFGNNDHAPRIFTLIIDSSRSMESLSHLIVAKQVSKALVELLEPADKLCIITFANDVCMGLPPTPISEFENGEIDNIIDEIDVRQGTLIGSGMKKAYEFLNGLESSDKQVMLITDGLTYASEPDDAYSVAGQMYDAGIVTSVFDVGRQGDKQDGSEGNDDSVAMQAKNMLKRIATAGHGNYYYSNNLESMDEVTFGKISDALTESVVQSESKVTAERRTDAILEGIITDKEGNFVQIPNISGYVVGTAKASANTVLSVEHVRTNSTLQRPLYTYWQYGNGKVSCFTSSFGGEWIENWMREGVAEVFFNNVLDTGIPNEKHSVPFITEVIDNGDHSTVEVDPGKIRFGAQVKLEVVAPNGTQTEEYMTFNASYFSADIETRTVGRYEFTITLEYNGASYVDKETFYVDFSAEHDEFAVYDITTLNGAMAGKGTVSEDGTLDLHNEEDEVGKISYALAMPLFIAVAVLFLIDVIIRKLKWEDIVSFFRTNKRAGGKEK